MTTSRPAALAATTSFGRAILQSRERTPSPRRQRTRDRWRYNACWIQGPSKFERETERHLISCCVRSKRVRLFPSRRSEVFHAADPGRPCIEPKNCTLSCEPKVVGCSVTDVVAPPRTGAVGPLTALELGFPMPVQRSDAGPSPREASLIRSTISHVGIPFTSCK